MRHFKHTFKTHKAKIKRRKTEKQSLVELGMKKGINSSQL